MLLALDFRDFPPAEVAVGFKDTQEISRLDGHMLPDIAHACAETTGAL